MENKRHGPNFMKLVFRKVAQDAIPPGGGLAAGLKFFADPELNKRLTRAAFEWVEEVMAVMKTAPDNPYGNDDEAIAAAILEQLEARE